MIKAENLSFGFPQKEILEKVSFTLDEGVHCALIGSNGTGKTTLAELIRQPEKHTYLGKLMLEDVGRIGYASQFAPRDKNQDATVFDYLCRDFVTLQQRIDALCDQMAEAEDLDAVMAQYQDLLDESESMDADNHEVNIHRQLHLSGLTVKADLPLWALSGGEYKLVQIIQQMLRRPGLLILDEPDVFLDFENLVGLRELINAYKGTLLVVTHSRYLLAHCFDKIWHLENGDLQEFDGKFIEYNYARLQNKIDLKIAAAKDDQEVARLEEMIERYRESAEEVIDPSRGRALRGKVSYLRHLQARRVKAPFVDIREPEVTLPAVETEEAETPLLTIENYSLAFEEKLLENVSFSVKPGEKVVLVGPNGTGKTSMLRQIWENDLDSVQFAENAKPAFFSQLQEDTLDENNSIYQEFFDIGFESTEDIEAHLEKYCLDTTSLNRKIRQLSGGEKNLLQLAKIAVSGANILLLDEPSSHLDTFAQIALEKALASYQGAVLMVSHDFYTVVNCADTILLVENGTLRPMSGRAFRKMIYKNHFSKDYLELEQQKNALEVKIAKALEADNCAEAQVLCDKLGEIIEEM
jgi:ATP-binding cassette subfamily F protein 3